MLPKLVLVLFLELVLALVLVGVLPAVAVVLPLQAVLLRVLALALAGGFEGKVTRRLLLAFLATAALLLVQLLPEPYWLCARESCPTVCTSLSRRNYYHHLDCGHQTARILA